MALSKDQQQFIKDLADSIKCKIMFSLNVCHVFDFTSNEIECFAENISDELEGALTVLTESKGKQPYNKDWFNTPQQEE